MALLSTKCRRFALFGPLLASLLCLDACAAPAAPYKTPAHWTKEGYALPPGADEELSPQSPTLAKSIAPSSESGKFARIAPPEPTLTSHLRGNDCLKRLSSLGVTYQPLQELEGVENPITIKGRLGGVEFWANDGRPLQMDCRLAIALEELRPIFTEHKVARARFSGAYVYRRTKGGRLSHHAYGLAIDIHEVDMKESAISIKKGYARGVGCRDSNPQLNRLFCSMRGAKLFGEFLTPDYNYDHHDHLHISVPKQ